jgi:hypothetical protein
MEGGETFSTLAHEHRRDVAVRREADEHRFRDVCGGPKRGVAARQEFLTSGVR